MKRNRWLLVVAGFVAVWILSACGGGGSAPGITDQTAPVIDGVRATRSANNQVLVEAQVYDDSEIETVEVLAVDGSLLTRQYTMAQDYGNRYRVELPQNVLRVTVRATDRTGKTAQSGEVLVPPPDAPVF
ncbi:MAG: hypothetical protein KatS3mg022_2836 [Armatimonadota bacterium]|nr:MAG: hypothetical protein KatS3mg022_2836 [Armatimonadota bacterium]